MDHEQSENSGMDGIQTIQRTVNDDQLLGLSGKKRVLRRTQIRMSEFLREYENQCGNISATCKVTGITRRTYYRWANGEAGIYRRFQKKISRIYPGARLQDAAHSVILHQLNQNSLDAAKFVYKEMREKSDDVDQSILADVAQRFQRFLEDYAEMATDAAFRAKWTKRFAETGKVPAKELAAKVGIPAAELEGVL